MLTPLQRCVSDNTDYPPLGGKSEAPIVETENLEVSHGFASLPEKLQRGSYMQAASTEIKIQSLLLRQIMHLGQKQVAESIGVAESQFSRWLGGEAGLKFEQYCRMLEILGTQILSPSEEGESSTSVSTEYLQALKVIARQELIPISVIT
ncbi:CII family transcriptional regulator, partial [Acidithiobacillus thiooxidans]